MSADLATVPALIQFTNIYQQLYNAFYQKPRHQQEIMDGDVRSTQVGEEEEKAGADDLKA